MRFTLSLLASLVATSLLAQQVEQHTESFHEPSDWWSLSPESPLKITYDSSGLELENTHPEPASIYRLFFIEELGDFRLEGGFSRPVSSSRAETGLMWGASEDLHGYCFLVSDSQRFQIGEWTYGDFHSLVNWQPHASIRPSGKNSLAVERTDGKLRFHINGQHVYTLQDMPLKGLNFGFQVGGKQTMKAHSFQLAYLRQPIHLIEGDSLPFRKENLGPTINSTLTDNAPKISHDGETLYFTRSNAQGKDDVWVSKLSDQGEWQAAYKLGAPINNSGHNFVISSSPDNNMLYLGNTYHPDGSNKGGGLSSSNLTKDGWEVPKPLQIDNYYNHSKFTSSCLAPSGQTLLLALDRDDTRGQQDLYYSQLQENGRWSTPRHMGNVLNTLAGELSPYLCADNRTLYFASKGHPGYGDADIFVAKRLGEGWESWTKPRNLGPSINTPTWDGYFTVPANGDFAYLTSRHRSLGEVDIFKVRLRAPAPTTAKEDTLPPAERLASHTPESVVIVYGKVLDANTRQPVRATLNYEPLTTRAGEAGEAHSHPVSGEYKIALPYGSHYALVAQAENYLPASENLDIIAEGDYSEIERNIYVHPVVVGEKIQIRNIFFARATATILPSSYPELNRLAELMLSKQITSIRLEGHTDNIGEAKKLKRLSYARAKAVREHLVAQGVQSSAVSIRGYGGSRPIAPNSSEAERSKNRRVEFVIETI